MTTKILSFFMIGLLVSCGTLSTVEWSKLQVSEYDREANLLKVDVPLPEFDEEQKDKIEKYVKMSKNLVKVLTWIEEYF